MSGGVTSKDNGYHALLKRVFDFERPRVAMGILEADGEEGHGSASLVTIIEIAQWMEFGFTTPDGTEVPARSFIRAWFDEASPKMHRDMAKLMRAVIQGKRAKAEILVLLGVKGVGDIQKRIAAGIQPKNTQSTIDQKGSSKPLIDTGQLRSSISYAVLEEDE